MTAVRVRGIYATALTALCRDRGLDVVDGSPPIRERFDAALPPREPDVEVETAESRQGVGVHGDPDGVAAVRDCLAAVSDDTFAWADPVPRGSVWRARVTATRGGGAVLKLGEGEEAYLPFDAAPDDAYVDEGDEYVVCVTRAAAPWGDDRPVASTAVEVPGTLCTLERGPDRDVVGTPRGADELAGMTDLLPAEVPDGWAVRWHRPAVDADMDAMGAALSTAADRAAAVDEGLAADDGDAPSRLAAPLSSAWGWFGRDGRFALDERRRSVVPTLPGHHRVKAGTRRASTAVDFAEQLGAAPDEFPFAAVAETFGPAEGDELALHHGKPDGRVLTLGRATVADVDDETGTVTVRREMSSSGTYDALGTPREPGDVAVTKYREGRPWAPTVYRTEEGTSRGTYCNVSTPVEVFPDAVRYVDLHVDVVKRPDGDVEIVDEEELAAAVDAGHVRDALADRARSVADRVADALR